MKISDVILPPFVRSQFEASSKAALLRGLAEAAAEATGLSANDIREALSAREALGSTGIGQGIALPHASIAGLEAPFAIAAQLKSPIEFEAIDGLPVDIVVLLLSPNRSGDSHIDRLACVAKHLRSNTALDRIRRAQSALMLYNAIISDDV